MHDTSRLDTAISLLAEGKFLDSSYRDHALKGSLKGARVCHIAPDWLLMYEKDKTNLIVHLMGTGTHRDVLGIE